MKAVGYKKPLPVDAHDSLLDIEMPIPVPGRHDLLVKVEAVSVNPVDVKVRASATPDGTEYKILGWDAAGVVTAAGRGCERFRVGDQVSYRGSAHRPRPN